MNREDPVTECDGVFVFLKDVKLDIQFLKLVHHDDIAPLFTPHIPFIICFSIADFSVILSAIVIN